MIKLIYLLFYNLAQNTRLVDELQTKDHLTQEISAQKSLIEQLVRLERSSKSASKKFVATMLKEPVVLWPI